IAADLFGAAGVTELAQRLPQQPVNDRPHRTPPVMVRLERRLAGACARQQAPPEPRGAAEVLGIEQPHLSLALTGVGGSREQPREARERPQLDVVPSTDVVVDAQAGFRVEAARQPLASALLPAG